MAYIKDLYRDEMRDGFLVTADRKKVWDAMLGLAAELKRICHKHGLRYFADGGTLLGAARHKGFIPWDDDIDFIMLPDDYRKFLQVAKDEIKPPFFLDIWYEHDIPDDWVQRWPTFPLVKLRDDRTTMLEFPECRTMHQGIWLDIFPMCPAPPFADETSAYNYEAQKELLFAISCPFAVRKAIEDKKPLAIEPDSLRRFMGLPFRQKAACYEEFLRNYPMKSDFVINSFHIMYKPQAIFPTSLYTKDSELPFETVYLPVPSDYDLILTKQYGDYKKIVRYPAHAMTMSADISYKEYFGSI